MKEDRFTHTEADAGRYEQRRGGGYSDGPTLAECQRDEAELDAERGCTCYWTDPATWTMYYGAAEPGSQMEPNPECPVHFTNDAPVESSPAVAEWLAARRAAASGPTEPPPF